MKLEKLKMPVPGKGKKPFPKKAEESPELEAGEEDLSLDLDGDEEEGEAPEHKALVLGKDLGPADEEQGPSPELETISDEDLLAELKKRGLSSKLANAGEEEAEYDSESMA